MSRTLVATIVLGGLLATTAPQALAQDTPMTTEAAAKALVPLLGGVRERVDASRWSLGPGSLPPSPFTGRQSQIVALTLGRSPVAVDPKVRKAMDQLQAWNIGGPPGPEAVLFGHWLNALQLRGAGLKTPPAPCDTTCVVELFTSPGEKFGSGQRQREEMRDRLLLEALVVAVEEMEPGAGR